MRRGIVVRQQDFQRHDRLTIVHDRPDLGAREAWAGGRPTTEQTAIAGNDIIFFDRRSDWLAIRTIDIGRFINDFDGLIVAATHGSPWSYDTFVPIFVAGPGIDSGVIHRRVAPTAIATTLAAYLGLKAPSGAVGDLLQEVLSK